MTPKHVLVCLFFLVSYINLDLFRRRRLFVCRHMAFNLVIQVPSEHVDVPQKEIPIAELLPDCSSGMRPSISSLLMCDLISFARCAAALMRAFQRHRSLGVDPKLAKIPRKGLSAATFSTPAATMNIWLLKRLGYVVAKIEHSFFAVTSWHVLVVWVSWDTFRNFRTLPSTDVGSSSSRTDNSENQTRGCHRIGTMEPLHTLTWRQMG